MSVFTVTVMVFEAAPVEVIEITPELAEVALFKSFTKTVVIVTVPALCVKLNELL